MTKESTQRIIWIDFVKVLAITIIVLNHSGAITSPITSPFLALGSLLFFTINGALVLKKERNIRYFISKALKILFVFVFWGSISSITQMVLNGESLSIVSVFKNTLELRMGYAHIFWFLCTLFALYCIYPALQSSIRDPQTCAFLVVISFLFCFKVYGYRIPTYNIPNIFVGWESESVFLALCGYIIISHNSGFAHRKIRLLCLAFIVVMYLSQMLAYSGIPFFSKHTPDDIASATFSFHKSPFVMLMALAIVLTLKYTKLSYNRLIEVIGQNTLGIYVTHGFFMRFARVFASEYINSQFIGKLIEFVIGFSLSLILSVLLSKNKYTKFLISL